MSEVAWRDVVLPSAPIVGEHPVEASVHIRRRCRLPKLSQQERNVGVEFDIVRRYFEEIFLLKKADAGVDSSTCLPLAIDSRVDCAQICQLRKMWLAIFHRWSLEMRSHWDGSPGAFMQISSKPLLYILMLYNLQATFYMTQLLYQPKLFHNTRNTADMPRYYRSLDSQHCTDFQKHRSWMYQCYRRNTNWHTCPNTILSGWREVGWDVGRLEVGEIGLATHVWLGNFNGHTFRQLYPSAQAYKFRSHHKVGITPCP